MEKPLWAPWRIEYIRAPKPTGCIFCEFPAAPESQDRENLLLHRGEHAFTCLNRYPYNSGHVMVIPRAHVSDLAALAQEAWADLQDELRRAGYRLEVLFCDASDEVLVRRFSESRRPHPLAPDGSALEGIRAERARLHDLKARADLVIDTSGFTVHEFRKLLASESKYAQKRSSAVFAVIPPERIAGRGDSSTPGSGRSTVS